MKLELYDNALEENVSNDYKVELLIDDRIEEVKCFHAVVRRELYDETTVAKPGTVDLFEGRTTYLPKMSYCRFSCTFDQPLKIRVKPLKEFNFIRIRPGKINYKIINGVIEFVLAKPSKLSIEIDGNLFENLFLFAEESENDIPQLEDKNVITFKKGVHVLQDDLLLSSGQTLYLEPGSFVYGCVRAIGENIKIVGKGILCGSKLNHDVALPRKQLLKASHCENLLIKDIFMIDSPTWTLMVYDCKNVVIDNVKQISWNENGDGIDICKSENVEVKNVFLRNSDDNISIKSRKYPDNENLYGFSCQNIYVHDSIFWADKAHCMLVGPEATMGQKSEFKNIRFENIVCLEHCEFMNEYQGVMAIFSADESVIDNVLWKNIEIYNTSFGRLISIKYTSVFAAAIGKEVKNIQYENIKYYGNQIFPDIIFGHDEEHIIENVTIKDMYVSGIKQTEKYNGIRMNGYTKNIQFI